MSTWFRDYVYIPLGGSKGSLYKKTRNVFLIFLISGFWHGANWTFIIWGGINALFFIPLLLLNKNRKNTDNLVAQNSLFPSLKEIVKIGFTYIIVLFGWIFFRSDTVSNAGMFLNRIITEPYINIERLSIQRYSVEILPLIAILILFEWFSRREEFPLYSQKHSIFKVSLAIFMILIFGSFSVIQDFIYFQF